MNEKTLVTASSGDVPYRVTLSDGRHDWHSDTVPANGGGDSAPDPESLVLGALGACTAITVSMYAARKQWPLTGVQVALSYARRDAQGTAIERRLELQGELQPEQRQRLREIAEKCPIHRLLTGPVEIATALG